MKDEVQLLVSRIEDVASGRFRGGHLMVVGVEGRPEKVTVFMTNDQTSVDNLKRMLSVMGARMEENERETS